MLLFCTKTVVRESGSFELARLKKAEEEEEYRFWQFGNFMLIIILLCVHSIPTYRLASFPGLPRFFCSSVSVDNNTRMRKGGEKRGRPGIIPHVSDVRWTQGWTWGGGGGGP